MLNDPLTKFHKHVGVYLQLLNFTKIPFFMMAYSSHIKKIILFHLKNQGIKFQSIHHQDIQLPLTWKQINAMMTTFQLTCLTTRRTYYLIGCPPPPNPLSHFHMGILNQQYQQKIPAKVSLTLAKSIFLYQNARHVEAYLFDLGILFEPNKYGLMQWENIVTNRPNL